MNAGLYRVLRIGCSMLDVGCWMFHLFVSSGRRTVTVVSCAGADSIWMVPLCAETIHWAMLKPRPQPSTVVAVRRIAAIKPVENARQRFRRDAGAGVGDGEFRRVARAPQAHRYAALRLVVFDGVVGEVEQQLAQPMPVAAHGDFLAGGQFHLDALRFGQNLRVGEIVAHEFVQPDRFQLQAPPVPRRPWPAA